jgi:hypothetical protein
MGHNLTNILTIDCKIETQLVTRFNFTSSWKSLSSIFLCEGGKKTMIRDNTQSSESFHWKSLFGPTISQAKNTILN